MSKPRILVARAIFPDIVYRRVLSDLAMYVVERAL